MADKHGSICLEAHLAPRQRSKETHSPPASLFAALILLGAFATFTVACEPGGCAGIDHPAAQLTARLGTGMADKILTAVYPFGTPETALIVTAGLSVVLLTQRGWTAVMLLLSAMTFLALVEGLLRVRGGGLVGGLSLIAQPSGWELTGGTYPSGHTARLVLLSGIGSLLLPPRAVRLGLGGALLAGILMALERVSSGHHTGSDVVGGLLLGGGLVAAFAAVLPSEQTTPPLVRGRVSNLPLHPINERTTPKEVTHVRSAGPEAHPPRAAVRRPADRARWNGDTLC